MTTKIPPDDKVLAHFARAAAQVDREQALAAQMRADLSREADRQAAELKVREGVSVNLADLAIPPTPEWERQGEAVNYTVKTEGANVQVVTTRRRVRVGQVMKAHRMGKITDDQFLACEWYQDQYERSGLEGKVRSVDLAAEVRSASTSGYVFNDGQLTAQTRLRAAREVIGARWQKFFDKVVLDNVPVHRAAKMAPSGRFPWGRIATCASDVFAKMQEIDPDWKSSC